MVSIGAPLPILVPTSFKILIHLQGLLVRGRWASVRWKKKRHSRRMGRTPAGHQWTSGYSAAIENLEKSGQQWRRQLRRCVSRREAHRMVSQSYL
jgi:hypothetical protein